MSEWQTSPRLGRQPDYYYGTKEGRTPPAQKDNCHGGSNKRCPVKAGRKTSGQQQMTKRQNMGGDKGMMSTWVRANDYSSMEILPEELQDSSDKD